MGQQLLIYAIGAALALSVATYAGSQVTKSFAQATATFAQVSK